MKRKVKRYDEGGVTQEDLDAANSSDDSIAALNARKGWTDTGEEAPTRNMASSSKTPSFKEAFASARAAGDKTFSWNGKKFTTELASSKPASKSVASDSQEAPKPKATYESSYDRMNRQNREQGIDFDSLVGKLKNRITGASSRSSDSDFKPSPRGKIDTSNLDKDTLLQRKGMKRGGSVKSSSPVRKTASARGDGIASRGKTRGRIV